MPVVGAEETNVGGQAGGTCHGGGLAGGGVSKQVTLEQDLKEARQQGPWTSG